MTTYALAQPVPGPRIVPFGEQRLPSDVLPNGNVGFRITQRFTDINPAFPENGEHGAADLGNYKCGDAVYAVWGGLAATIGPDRYGALGVIIDHGAFSSLYWHLNAFSIARGTAVPVTRGQQLGIVGKTGLGAVCHLHFELKVDGERIDPAPYLLGAPLVIEDAMPLPANLQPLVQATIGGGNNIRSAPSLTADKYLLEASGRFTVIGYVSGEQYTLNSVTSNVWACVARNAVGFVARPLLSDLRLAPAGANLAGDATLEAKLATVRKALPTLVINGKTQVTALEALEKVVA